MRIAAYNVNGVNGRLANLLVWLEEAAPDIVCLQELKAPDGKFPVPVLRSAGYGAVWHGQKSWNGVAILARGAEPVETRRGLPGDPDDPHSRYIEATIGGLIVGCLYLPNGDPVLGPKFEYKLRWFERLTSYSQSLLDNGAPVVLAGDFNVMPTELDVYAPERWHCEHCTRAIGSTLSEIFPKRLRPRRRPAHRSSVVEPCHSRPPCSRGC
jgi:exodeoxyribonuclease-3